MPRGRWRVRRGSFVSGPREPLFLRLLAQPLSEEHAHALALLRRKLLGELVFRLREVHTEHAFHRRPDVKSKARSRVRQREVMTRMDAVR